MTTSKKPKGITKKPTSTKSSKGASKKKRPAGTAATTAKPTKARSKTTKADPKYEIHLKPEGLRSGFAIKMDLMREAKALHDAARVKMHFDNFTVFPSQHCPNDQVFCSPKTMATIKAVCDYAVAAFTYIRAFETEI